jgi:hypothetical protein
LDEAIRSSLGRVEDAISACTYLILPLLIVLGSPLCSHNGIWVDTVKESLVFDKKFFEEIYRRAWVPRNQGTSLQDWTWGGPMLEGSKHSETNDVRTKRID